VGRRYVLYYFLLRYKRVSSFPECFCNICVMHPVVCMYNSVKWGRLHNNAIYRMHTKIRVDTNLSTFVYYVQMLTHSYLLSSSFRRYYCCVDVPIYATVL
jgi:hypothetical protein